MDNCRKLLTFSYILALTVVLTTAQTEVNPKCRQPMKAGTCKVFLHKWYYDTKEQKCKIFVYGGCEGNENRFNSEDECMSTCIKCSVPIDLVFALDASGSVEISGFSLIKSFTKTLVGGFEFGPKDSHVGILTFSENGEVQIRLTETFDKIELLQKIDNLKYPGFRTNTKDALDVAAKDMFSLAGGARQGVPKVLILLTDGKCTLCGKKGVKESADNLKNEGVTIFTIGVTDSVNQFELEQISSNPSEDHMFDVKDFDQLKTIISSLKTRTCKVKKGKCMRPEKRDCTALEKVNSCTSDDSCDGIKKCCNNGCSMSCTYPLLHCLTSIDVAFALDASSSVTTKDFARMKDFAGFIADSFAVSQQEARFASLIYSRESEVRFSFVKYDTAEQVKNAIGELSSSADDTRIDRALQLAKSDLFSLSGKVRTRRPMVLIVFFDGDVSRGMRDLEEFAAPLKNYGVKIVAIGVGPEFNIYQVNKVASSPSMIYNASNFDAMMPKLFSIAKETCTEKFGDCQPDPDPIEARFCVGVVNECENDFDCFGNSKCCKRGCKRTCVRPPNVCKRKMDIAFAIHNNMEETDFYATKYYVQSVIEQFEIGDDKTHIALMTFGPDAKVVFDFNSDQSSNAVVKSRINKLQYQKGKGPLSSVLALSCDAIFCKLGGTRDPYHKLMIIVTGPLEPSDNSILEERIKTLRNRGVDVLIVGVGNVDASVLQKITADNQYAEDRVMLSRDFSGIIQYIRDIPDFGCGQAATNPKEITGCQPKTCVKGLKGSRGRPGDVGEVGYPAARGPQGSEGLQGAKGTMGTDGVTGGKGGRGDVGLRGLPGFTGYNGIPGVPGEIGRPGKDGDCGLPGKSGEAGMPGLDGFVGQSGLPGPTGGKGVKGVRAKLDPNMKIFPGDKGIRGEAGVQDRKGTKGEEGPRGFNGNLGINGEMGIKGNKGDMGQHGKYINQKGSKGNPGEIGPRGQIEVTEGPSSQLGLTGIDGERGEKGNKGTKGPQGKRNTLSGRKGQIGIQGIKGYKGYKGQPGGIGWEGVRGIKGFRGDKGDLGPLGIAGFPGKKGITGDGGARGKKGVKGDFGDEVAPIIGIPGVSGKRGDGGFPGREGPVGKRGAKGNKGQQGEMQMGPTGDLGAIGNRGHRGNDGLPGMVGMEGLRGPAGTNGESGARGDQGLHAKVIPGKFGMRGPPGSFGDAGPIGNTGPPGRKGNAVTVNCVESICPKGKKGQSGAPGNTGPPGKSGPHGASGPKGHPYPPCPICSVGVQGLSGEPGNPGYPGQNGAKGFSGDIGDIGKKGHKGESGPGGFEGIKGAKGDNGAEGSIGMPGTDSPGDVSKAPVGIMGTRGSTGSDGSRGPKGKKGRNGNRGPAGAQGSRGKRGIKGTSGTTGIIGTNGLPGRPGADGGRGVTAAGRPGVPGVLGRQGGQGDTGDKGPDGRKGWKGTAPTEAEIQAVRAAGIEHVGESGVRGQYGDVGKKGMIGPLGPRGPKGGEGPQGRKGYGGVKGEVGGKGQLGTTGDQGNSGLPGKNGKRGPSGESGKGGKRGEAPKGMKGEPGLPGIDGRPGPDGSFPRVGCIDFGDPTDLAFIMDSSRSVTVADFERQKTFIKNFLKRFPIGPTQTQAGIIKYGKTADIEIRFSDYSTASELEEAIDKIQHSSASESRLDLAFMLARDQLFTIAQGSRGQLANKALVVMGDGFISGGGKKAVKLQNNALKYAKDLKVEGVTVFALGVGAERNKYLLKLMVSDESYYLEIETYTELLTKIYQVQSELEDKSCTYTGDPGRDGLPGLPGDDGDTGQKGRMGRSPQGKDGKKGPKGYKGPVGAGENGPPGVSGIMGLMGERGYPGRDGLDVNGVPGEKGSKGDKSNNVLGPKGEVGNAGIVGPQGPSSQSLCDFVLATDIIFVLDSSSSVGHENFHKMKVFIQTIIKSFDIDNQLTRASVISYDEVAVLEIPLDRHNSLNTLLENIERLRYRNGQATRTDLALLMAQNSGFTEKNGARNGVNQVLVFMTDGQQSYAPDQISITDAVEPLIDAGVKRYAIGIGREIDATELRTIAGDNIVYADDFDQLKLKINDQIGIIARRGCRGYKGLPGRDGKDGTDGKIGADGPPGSKGTRGVPGLEGLKGYKGTQGDGLGFGSEGDRGDMGSAGPRGLPGCAPGNQVTGNMDVITDLVFLLDASGSLYPQGFKQEKEFVKSVIDKMGKITYEGTHVGIIVYSDEANIRVKLNDHYSNEDIKQAIDNIPYDSQGTRIDLGLKEAKKIFALDTVHGARGNSKKVLILLTDGQQTYVPRVTEPSVVAKGLIADGIDIFSIGIGPEIDRTELESFISKPEYLFLAEDIDTIVQEVSGEITTALRCEGGPRGPSGESGSGGPYGGQGVNGKQGPPGERGPRGEPGFGPKGEPGNTGPKIEGNKGMKGKRGFRGPAGPEGNAGRRGKDGYPGPRGQKGDTAEPGFVGNQGRTGSTGNPGETGVSVGPGTRGPRGAIGIKGRRGPRGDAGTLPLGNVLDDYRGNRGVQGDRGIQGKKGKKGEIRIATGPPGKKGLTGDKGDNGNLGSRGEQGETGGSGFPGLLGDNGLAGDQGIDGLKGRAGDQGAKGTLGFQGRTRKGEPGEGDRPGPIGKMGSFGEKGFFGFIGMPGIKGDEGESGFPGRDGDRDNVVSPRGPRGYKGEMGDIGIQGMRGEPAPIIETDEFKGDKGEQGQRGNRGASGTVGEGNSGSLGSQGPTGPTGYRGLSGDIGLRGSKGQPGVVIGGSESGDIGKMGLKGRRGSRGMIGDVGKLGLRGDRGLPGAKGISGNNGFNGLRGDQGPPGRVGDQGPQGKLGPTGRPGEKGPPGPSGIAEGFYIVRHSQDPYVPQCPRTYKKLWDGYSLMYTVGNGKSHSQDLGDPGSCSKSFSTMPFIFCDISGSCKYASRNDFVYWLSSRDVTQPMMPVSNAAIEPFISRCVVCEAPSIHIAVHSQDLVRPDCPRGWESLWHGFSFMMVAGAGKTGAGQSLSSSGSCLETFLPKPFIECQGARGTCHFFSDKYSFWLTTIDVRTQFETQQPQTLIKDKGHDLKSRVSRCRVCVRSKGGRGDGPDGSNFLSRFRKSINKIFGTD